MRCSFEMLAVVVVQGVKVQDQDRIVEFVACKDHDTLVGWMGP